MTTALIPVLQEVSVTFNLGQVLTWIIVGIIAGILASLLVRGFRYGLVGSLILGLVGAIIGGLLFQVVRIQAIENLGNQGFTITYRDIITSFIGAVIALIFLALIFRRRV